MILTCEQLTYLDQRPVRDKDRIFAQAWSRGGLEAERAVKDEMVKQEQNRMQAGILKLIK